jgi:hypothetical protein
VVYRHTFTIFASPLFLSGRLCRSGTGAACSLLVTTFEYQQHPLGPMVAEVQKQMTVQTNEGES